MRWAMRTEAKDDVNRVQDDKILSPPNLKFASPYSFQLTRAL